MQLRTDPNLRWTRWAEASALFVAVLAATAYSLLLTRHTGSNVTMWIADGVVVGALLRVSDERWPRYLAAAFAGYFTGKMLLGDPLISSTLLGLVNGVEVMIVARGVRRGFPRIQDDTPFLRLGQTAMLSTLAASLVSALLAAFVLYATANTDFWTTFDWWFRSHLLGMVIVATLTLVVLVQGWRMLGRRGHRLVLLRDLLLLGATTVFVFAQSRYPLLFVVFAPLLYVVIRHRFPGLVIGVAVVTLTANIAIAMGGGPLGLIPNASAVERSLLGQFFLGMVCLVAVPIALAQADRRRLARRVRDSEVRYRLLADYASDLVMRIARDGSRRYVSPSIKDLLGWEVGEFMLPRPDLIHPDDRERVDEAMEQLWATERMSLTRYRLRHKKGYYVWIEALVRVMPSPEHAGEMELIYTGRDITESIVAEQALADSETRLRRITDKVPALITHIGIDERYIFVSGYAREITGLEPEAMVGRSVRETRGAALYSLMKPHIAAVLQGRETTFEYEFERDGRYFYLQATYLPATSVTGENIGFYALTTDVTRIKLAEQKLSFLAHYDTLTNLANRRYFTECAHAALERAAVTRAPMLLMLIDVDYFKQINDGHGHASGDAVLREVARRLKASVRKSDLVARLGGDEFVILCDDVDATYAAESLAGKVIASMAAPISLDAARLKVTLSVGAALCRDIASLDELVQRADEALYEAKEAGRACYRLVVERL
ncbi:diguanylate cyclase (GGDEF)-like protein/PAS domain S-box-containing protein [Dyella sp. SG562]|uniref:sensor domain-containing diguanylate cyclase n=1 Tax=Dyella sp. SG562 TaxID=2587017 RepID=UPI0014246FBF|nr:sensor domain-containing diguanylate cyclase [Dyella sp. SG562]NII74797.1 diguanylate cyclase (GGDEF)-like protein/PAS domain S-box-containing protein [Dyella sp. SG562]